MEMEPNIAKGNLYWTGKLTCLKNQSRFTATEAIEKLHGGRVISREEVNGAVHVKIVVSKQELRKMGSSMSQGWSNAIHHCMAAPPSLEQLLHVLRKRHMKRAEAGKGYRPGGWRPALLSIPEEIS